MEIRMKERELAMENLARDAQLKVTRRRSIPFSVQHLKCGQLAMMEDGTRTYAFIENMASFFRVPL